MTKNRWGFCRLCIRPDFSNSVASHGVVCRQQRVGRNEDFNGRDHAQRPVVLVIDFQKRLGVFVIYGRSDLNPSPFAGLSKVRFGQQRLQSLFEVE